MGLFLDTWRSSGGIEGDDIQFESEGMEKVMLTHDASCIARRASDLNVREMMAELFSCGCQYMIHEIELS